MHILSYFKTGFLVSALAAPAVLFTIGAAGLSIGSAKAHGQGPTFAQAVDGQSAKTSNQQNTSERDQKHIELLRSQVASLLGAGDVKGALSLLDREIAKDQANPGLYLLRASVYCFADQLRACENDASRAIAANSNFVAAYLYRAVARLDLHQIRDALSDCETAVRLAPDLPAPYNCRGMVYRATRDFATALAEFDTALAKDAKFALAHFNKGVTFAMQNQQDAAITSFSAAIALNSSHDDWFVERGKVFVTKGDSAAGRADFLKALALNRRNISAAGSLQALQVPEALDVLAGKK